MWALDAAATYAPAVENALCRGLESVVPPSRASGMILSLGSSYDLQPGGQMPKGLTADGSTRAWREARERIPGPKRCVVCGTTKNLQANHKRPRQGGGGDNVSNLEWRCIKHQTYVGRPRGS